MSRPAPPSPLDIKNAMLLIKYRRIPLYDDDRYYSGIVAENYIMKYTAFHNITPQRQFTQRCWPLIIRCREISTSCCATSIRCAFDIICAPMTSFHNNDHQYVPPKWKNLCVSAYSLHRDFAAFLPPHRLISIGQMKRRRCAAFTTHALHQTALLYFANTDAASASRAFSLSIRYFSALLTPRS